MKGALTHLIRTLLRRDHHRLVSSRVPFGQGQGEPRTAFDCSPGVLDQPWGDVHILDYGVAPWVDPNALWEELGGGIAAR